MEVLTEGTAQNGKRFTADVLVTPQMTRFVPGHGSTARQDGLIGEDIGEAEGKDELRCVTYLGGKSFKALLFFGSASETGPNVTQG